MDRDLYHTPLTETHQRSGARMVAFAGWWMPLQYGGILQEALAVRRKAGVFDISHMGRLIIEGEQALDVLEQLTTNEVATLAEGGAQYSLLTNHNGGVIDDILVYRLAVQRFLLVVNAANTPKDLEWIRQHLRPNVTLTEITSASAMIALQGPEAVALAEATFGCDLLSLPRFHFTHCRWGGEDIFVARTGYTGEDGVEIILPPSQADALWNALTGAGAAPCGLGARDVLRIEAGYPLYGHELSEEINPIEAGLGWVVSKRKQFIGSEPIQRVREQGTHRKLVGLQIEGRMVARQGYAVQVSEQSVGEITSGTFSPWLEQSIAMAFVQSAYAQNGTQLWVDMRGKRVSAQVVSKRFVSHV